ncbi:hypothetical protein A1O3_07228 [Capronia epimyces CBS 606.96]|uniref:MmgE/PrpD family protein n=1 Tax=Capronia epimyces CBS 606.96 TaxID=1182542 RepID=W9XUD1_9EURO|nr:uncharacterized protein A1O3_07228 [Capronia epimyces CBS 606.96]EXJ80940.1 hypothetical protein A1O3_07228 [Capronia epimyces CBS 606.96]
MADVKDNTHELATFLSHLTYDQLPQEVVDVAKASILNIIGCAIGSSDISPRRKAIAALLPGKLLEDPSAAGAATIWGRPERTDVETATILNGIAATARDYDDTLLRTVIHPSCTAITAVLPWAEVHHLSGKELILGFVAAFETQAAVANAISPSHYDNGWHITGSTGAFSAAGGIAKLLKLNPDQFAAALGHASSMASGTRAMFGSDTKTLHVGHHGRNGIVAGKLARHNFFSCPAPIEAWARLVSTTVDMGLISDLACGGPWQILSNAFKPYPCGIVIHPLIDACLEVSRSFSVDGEVKPTGGPRDLNDLAEIQVTANPQLLRLCNVRHPRTGLETIFSLYHGCAVALVYGRATPAEFSDDVAANDALVHSIRDRVSVQTDAKLRDDEAYVTFTSRSKAHGAQAARTVYIEHATGSVRNPMTKAQLEEKFVSQTEPHLGKEKTRRVIEACWTLESIEDVGELAKLLATTPSP